MVDGFVTDDDDEDGFVKAISFDDDDNNDGGCSEIMFISFIIVSARCFYVSGEFDLLLFYWIQSQTVHRKNTYTKTFETKNHVVPQQQQERRFPTPPNQITEFLI
jgi:hypothetical protein